MAKIIDGKAISAKIRQEIAAEVESLKSRKGITPGLAVVLVGSDPASQTYVNSKEKACKEVGMYSEVIRMSEDTTEEELLRVIDTLNNRKEINGILVQLPLPRHIDEKKIIDSISPAKDVDGFHPMNAGNLLIGTAKLVPCTPRGVIELLDAQNIEIAGKNAVVIGRSNIVGKPVALLLMQRNATVTICHSRTKDLDVITRQADILVVGIGRAKMVKASMVKEGAVVIDVGINRVDGKLVGDVDYDDVFEKCSAITPVPGGVGPMTIAMLLRNTLIAAQE